MPFDLAAVLEPAHTVLVTVELQVTSIGPVSATNADLAAAGEGPMLGHIAALARSARRVGVPVVHCLVAKPPGVRQVRPNRLSNMGRGRPPAPVLPNEELLHPAVGAEPTDVYLRRQHGLTPMVGTDLDGLLRALDATTVVFTGVSVNLALLGATIAAADHSYQVVIPRDATAGIGADVVDVLYDAIYPLLATVTSSDQVRSVWDALPAAVATSA